MLNWQLLLSSVWGGRGVLWLDGKKFGSPRPGSCSVQIFQREVSHISCLPQGDPASPRGLLGPLYESMCRIRKKFEKPKHGRTLYRISIDDRSWFCAEARTAVAVATAWKKEVAQLRLAEKQGKNDFAAFGGIVSFRTVVWKDLDLWLDVSSPQKFWGPGWKPTDGSAALNRRSWND